MTVYVDEPRHPYGRMLMCHMIADTPAELHLMAERIGISRRWYQGHASFPHYDVCKAKRAEAIAAGAKAVTTRQLGLAIRRIRATGAFDTETDE